VGEPHPPEHGEEGIMAYLVDLDLKCLKCGKRALVRLVDRWNGDRGKFCRKCGKTQLEQQKRNEGTL
jgi:ribosomal protein L40E